MEFSPDYEFLKIKWKATKEDELIKHNFYNLVYIAHNNYHHPIFNSKNTSNKIWFHDIKISKELCISSLSKIIIFLYDNKISSKSYKITYYEEGEPGILIINKNYIILTKDDNGEVCGFI